jgi:hypothetical protein
MDTSLIPNGCSSEQLFQDAEEVLSLQTELAGLETQFRTLYIKYFNEAPSGFSESMRGMHAEQQIQERHTDFWTEIDSKRARYKGLIAKASIIRCAVYTLGVEQGVLLPS